MALPSAEPQSQVRSELLGVWRGPTCQVLGWVPLRAPPCLILSVTFSLGTFSLNRRGAVSARTRVKVSPHVPQSCPRHLKVALRCHPHHQVHRARLFKQECGVHPEDPVKLTMPGTQTLSLTTSVTLTGRSLSKAVEREKPHTDLDNERPDHNPGRQNSCNG